MVLFFNMTGPKANEFSPSLENTKSQEDCGRIIVLVSSITLDYYHNSNGTLVEFSLFYCAFEFVLYNKQDNY